MTQFTYLIAMEKLKTGDSINLLDMKSLSYVDLDKLFENIKFWKIHGNYEFNLKRINPKKNLVQQKTYFALDFKNNNESTTLLSNMSKESPMSLTIHSRDLEVIPAMRKHIEKSLQQLRMHFDDVMDATVFFMIDSTSEIVLRHTAELTIHLKDREFFADAQNKDLYQAIDAVISKLECQVLKHKEQIQNYYEKHID